MMTTSAAEASLENIRVGLIDPNPENPRIHFRQKEMDELMESIALHGVQVPVAVYRAGKRYVLIDGERRWRCAIKLNLATLPAMVQRKPDTLTNLLLMFNIHALREQWDLLTIATKLAKIINMLEAEKKGRPTEIEISRKTGLSRAVIRRCRYLLNLPSEFQDRLQKELKKPKQQQKLTEDFFIEMERALTTVERAMPQVIPDRNQVRRVLVDKFERKVIDNRTHFRQVAKIASAAKIDASIPKAESALRQLFTSNDFSVVQAYESTVADAYSEREITTRIDSLIERLNGMDISPGEIDGGMRQRLLQLIKVARRVLGS